MNHNMIDRVRLLAPPAEVSETGRTEQRWKLENAIAAESVLPEAGGVPSERRKWRLARGQASRRRVYLAGAAATIAAAAGTVIPLSLGVSTPAASGPTKGVAPVMQLASYRLRLPANYHLTAAATSNCPDGPLDKIAESFTPAYAVTPEFSATGQAKYPTYEPQMKTAASAEGGCISMILAPPYAPTSSPDPEAALVTNAEPVQVGPYQGAVGTGKAFIIPSDKTGPFLPETIYVEIPIGGGQYEDLVVNAYGMSSSALVSLVQNGLSVAGGSVTSGTPIGAHQDTGVAGNSGNSSGAAGNSGMAGNTDTAGNSGTTGNSGASAS